MKGILVEKRGGPEVLKLKDLPVPKPGPGQVLVKLKASGINFADVYMRRGVMPVPLPFTPGFEGSGIVESVGQGVTDFKVGERVVSVYMKGAYADFALAPADTLLKLPDNIPFELAAAFAVQGITAHYLINEFRDIKQGEYVLIHAAAGGMGLLLVQWAKHLGAKVIGTVSSEDKANAAMEAGSDEVIIYTKQNFVDEAKRITKQHGVDLIIDGVGKTTFPGDLEVAARRGTIVLFGMSSGIVDPFCPNDLMNKSITLCGGSLYNFVTNKEEATARFSDVVAGISEGWLKVKVQERLSLEGAPKAHELLESRKVIGKIVLTQN